MAPPALPSRLVDRSRLTAALDGYASGPLTLVSAGPGWGKSVLLSSWAHSRPEPIAWLSLEPADNNPERFWQLVGEAFQAAGLVPDADRFSSLPHCASNASGFIRAFLECVPDPARLVLVVDDAHLLTDATLLAELDALIRYGYPAVSLVMAARSDLLLPLHRYRLADQMHELRAADLAMTRPEAEALLIAHEINLSPPDLDRLTARTEGWAAGLRLSAMSMAGSAHPERFVTQLAHDHGSVAEYLMEEVLEQLPAQARQLLIETSFLDEVSGDLAAAVTGIPHSPAILAELARTNSFVVPADAERQLYRYHHLMGEVLSYMLARERTADLQVLRRRAARWYDSTGAAASAMRFAMQADDWAHAAAVLVRGGFAQACIQREDLAALGLRGLAELPAGRLVDDAARLQLQVAQAAIAVAAGDLDLARQRLAEAGAARLDTDSEATSALVRAAAAHHGSSIEEADAAAQALLGGCAGADPAEGAVQRVPGLDALLRLGQASARFWQGRPPAEVDQHLAEALGQARAAGAAALELECLGLMKLAYVASGRLGHAAQCEALVDALLRQEPQLKRMTVNHLATAHAVRRARQMVSPSTPAAVRVAAALMDARIRVARDELADAYQLLQLAPEPAGTVPPVLTQRLQLAMADIETRLGRPNAALRTVEAAAAGPADAGAALTRARAHLGLADARAARAAIHPVLSSSSTAPALPALIEALLVSARIAELQGDEATAVSESLRAVALGAGEIVQPFADARAPLAALLARHPQAAQAWPAPLGEPEPDPGPAAGARRLGVPAVALFDSLTDRETTILRRLATTMTTAEIAAELHVSINTVKTHIAAVYRKLPAGSRRDAVARARELELL